MHRRLWSVVLKLQSSILPSRIAVIEERHMTNGRHEVRETPLAEWVAEDVKSTAARLDPGDALRTLEGIAPLASMLDA